MPRKQVALRGYLVLLAIYSVIFLAEVSPFMTDLTSATGLLLVRVMGGLLVIAALLRTTGMCEA